jgi:hypothetical protein
MLQINERKLDIYVYSAITRTNDIPTAAIMVCLISKSLNNALCYL